MHAVKLAVAAVRIIVSSAIKQATRKSAANPLIINNIARFGLNEGTKNGLTGEVVLCLVDRSFAPLREAFRHSSLTTGLRRGLFSDALPG